jgi:hypothetical protein
MELSEKVKTLQDSILDQIMVLESDIDFCERSLARSEDSFFIGYFRGRKLELLNRKGDLSNINLSLQTLIGNK